VSQDVDQLREVVGQLNGPPTSGSVTNTLLRPFLAQIAPYWWVELLLGVLWAHALLAGDEAARVE
jgi:hypothetical protein